MPVDMRRQGEDGLGQFGPALFACRAPYHLDCARKNADALLPDDVRRKGEDGFFGSLAIWAVPFACKAPYHLDRVRKNADALLARA